jgi:Ca2+-binding EF-hand superfamily protein
MFVFFCLEYFVLPREEARRLFRAYNHIWDLKIDENKLQRVLDSCARNGNTAIDEALKLLAK